VILKSDVLAWLSLEQSIEDEKGNTPTLNGSFVFVDDTPSNIFSSSVFFDENSFVDTEVDTSIDSSGFSVSFWAKIQEKEGSDDVGGLFLAGDKSTFSVSSETDYLSFTGDTTISSIVFENGSSVTMDIEMVGAAWNHYVFSYTDSGVDVYINGVKSTDLSQSFSVSSQVLSETFEFGRSYIRNASGFRYFRGLMQSFVVIDKDLVQSEVDSLYNSGKGVRFLDLFDEPLRIENDLESYYSLDDKSNVIDSTGNYTSGVVTSTSNVFDTSAVRNTGLEFSFLNGSEVNFSGHTYFTNTSDFCVSCYVTVYEEPTGEKTVWEVDDASNDLGLFFDANKFLARVDVGGSTLTVSYPYNRIGKDVEFFKCVTVLLRSSNLYLFIDGDLKQSEAGSGKTDVSTGDWRLNDENNTGGFIVDEISSYSTGLSDSDVRVLNPFLERGDGAFYTNGFFLRADTKKDLFYAEEYSFTKGRDSQGININVSGATFNAGDTYSAGVLFDETSEHFVFLREDTNDVFVKGQIDSQGKFVLSNTISNGSILVHSSTEFSVSNGNGELEKYDLSTAWDYSTASLTTTYSVLSGSDSIRSACFTDNGKTLVIGYNQDGSDFVDDYVVYRLGTAYDIGSRSQIETGSISDTDVVSFYVFRQGLKAFFLREDRTAETFELRSQYDLSSRISRSSDVLNLFDGTGFENTVFDASDIVLNESGERMTVVYRDPNTIESGYSIFDRTDKNNRLNIYDPAFSFDTVQVPEQKEIDESLSVGETFDFVFTKTRFDDSLSLSDSFDFQFTAFELNDALTINTDIDNKGFKNVDEGLTLDEAFSSLFVIDPFVETLSVGDTVEKKGLIVNDSFLTLNEALSSEFLVFNSDFHSAQIQGSQSINVVVPEKWSVRSVKSAQVWLDGSDDTTLTIENGKVADWIDKINEYDVDNTNTNLRPLYDESRNAVVFTGGDEVLEAGGVSAFAGDSNMTFALVVNPESTTTSMNYVVLGDNNISGGAVSVKQRNDSEVQAVTFGNGNTVFSDSIGQQKKILIMSYTSGSNSFRCWQNGTSETVVNTNITGLNIPSSSLLRVGRIPFTGGNQGRLDSDVFEITIFNTALSQSEREKVEGYYAHKYGLVDELPGSHPYKDVEPKLENTDDIKVAVNQTQIADVNIDNT